MPAARLHADWRPSRRLHSSRSVAGTASDCDILHADKGYDANAIPRQVEERGAIPNIPPKANRKWKNCFSPFLYLGRGDDLRSWDSQVGSNRIQR